MLSTIIYGLIIGAINGLLWGAILGPAKLSNYKNNIRMFFVRVGVFVLFIF